MQIIVRDNNIDQALKALKKKMQREGIFREMKLRGAYEKPSEKRARERAEAVRRYRKPFALHALALQLAIAADGLGPLAGALLARLLIGTAELHLPEDAFALHLLLQRLERLVDVVVADDDLQSLELRAVFKRRG